MSIHASVLKAVRAEGWWSVTEFAQDLRRREGDISRRRDRVVYRLRKSHWALSFPDIGRLLGLAQSSVVKACQREAARLAALKTVEQKLEYIWRAQQAANQARQRASQRRAA